MAVLAQRPTPSPSEEVCDLRDLLDIDIDQPLHARCLLLPRPRMWLDAMIVRDGAPLLIVEGAVLHTVNLRQRTGGELLGSGDLLANSIPGDYFQHDHRTLQPSRVAVLDRLMWQRLTVTPGALSAVLDAVSYRTATLVAQIVAAQMSNLGERMRMLLPSIAERWGVVTTEGVILPSFLTHRVLSTLLGARRPSVTTALVPLHESGALRRLPDDRWMLAPGFAGLD